ncbi:MAG: glycoside hydrolase family 5 protein [Prevotella sp.]|nr:glycoside hydrolase family 5 protein [Prevotella sp.]
MNKKFTTAFIFMASLFSLQIQAQEFETATEAVKNMGVGWNLGNTLEANSQTYHDFTKDNYWGQQGLESETCWGQSKAKPELIKMMKDAGFGAIRVPVTWYNHMDKDGKVNAEWMKRVHEVVDYVINQGLYCIVNVHHDTGADNDSFKSWIKADEANYTQNKARYENLWQQIAEEFKDYDEHLLFESYNEMLDKLSSWCFASYAAKGQYDATVATSAYNAINSYAQSFVTTVRNTGGNNATRNLVVNTYAACCGNGTWSDHLKEPLSQLTIPTDPAANHLMVQVHDYPNIANDIANVKKEIDDMMAAWNTHILSKGIPMILGEWGTANVDKGDGKTDYDVRRDVMFEFVDYMVKKCKENNVATFYWMGLSDGAFRSQPLFSQPDLAETIVKAYYGNTDLYKYPKAESGVDFLCFDGEKALSWGDGISINSAIFKVFDKSVNLALTYTITENSGTDIQLYYGDWSDKLTYYVDGKSYNADYNPSGSKGTSQTATITFSESVYNTIKQKGLIIHGTGVTITKAIMKSGTTGIKATTYTLSEHQPIYNLHGQQISKPKKGIYIQNGKKYIAR